MYYGSYPDMPGIMNDPPRTRGLRIAVCGGGTGGHVIPALSICDKIKELKPEVDILYIGAANSLEESLAKKAGYPFRSVWISSLRRGRILSNIMLPLKCAVSLCQAVYYLFRHRPKMVIGTGGFSAWPACSAASITGRSYVLWEPNAFPGLVTRLLARGAKRIYVSFEETIEKLRLKEGKFLVTGNPVCIIVSEMGTEEARRAFGLKPSNRTIFVTGGSGGAKSINTVVDRIKNELLERKFNLIWQTGKHWDGETEVPFEHRERMVIQRFFDQEQMSLAYNAADFAISRCGAMTLAELAVVGLPAILVPFPFAAEGHQEANARAVEVAGGGMMILDKDLTPETLLEAIEDISQENRIKEMASGMKKLARTDAADDIATDILGLIG